MFVHPALSITDPVPETRKPTGPLGRLVLPLIRDERDLPFIWLALFLTVLLVPLAVVMFIPGLFQWWMAAIYWVLYPLHLGPYVLMLHNTSHRVLFKKRYGLLNRYIPWVVGPFLGMAPETYYAHHIGMHHQDGNQPDDLSSTMDYQRDSFLSFLRYFLNFLVCHPKMTAYFRRTRRLGMLRRFWVGELSYLALTVGLLLWNWQPALVVFAAPALFTRLMLMAGNWGQHAFIDHDEPANDWSSVISFVNSGYNHRCFNDGYHLGHHIKASRHWLDMPGDFVDKLPEMVRQRSIVFRKIDYFVIFLLLMFKRYRFLARFYVQLDPDDPLSEEQIVALFHERLRRFSPEELEAARQRARAPKGKATAPSSPEPAPEPASRPAAPGSPPSG